ncbi:hypothetical protein [Nocardioides humi]|uniref:hypothetical protein n=1 Tax=Nocardioides humi TaxID=449461 RepID=UPI00112AC9D8|nr:hypothetical protein [Nocardioides humi]
MDRSAVHAAVRALTDEVCRDLTPAWAEGIRTAATAGLDRTDDRLDAELAALPAPVTGAGTGPWRPVRAAGAVCAVLGLLLLAGSLTGLLGLPAAVGAVVLAGGAVAALAGHLAGRSADARAAGRPVADDRSRQVVARVMRAQVLDPVRAELASYGRFRAGLDAAGVTRLTP